MAVILIPMFALFVWIYRNPLDDKLLWLKQKVEPTWTVRMVIFYRALLNRKVKYVNIFPFKLAKQYPYDYYRSFPYEEPTKWKILTFKKTYKFIVLRYPILNYSFEPAGKEFDPSKANARFPFNETSFFRAGSS